VLSEWRFGYGNARGHGVSALFSGPPGTGKTAAAGAVAQALEINLYVINLSSIMSKWVGETEENLARVFDEAEASSVALLFDEADSLFGKRSAEMRSANDRFANITINYLLQRMETYGGLAILTTNLESAIDTAFSRRITNRVVFPAPDLEYRVLLWRELLPAQARYADDVDLETLARQFELPGARVKSALARAAFRVAASGRREPILAQADLVWAAENEYKDMGLLASRRGP
jgi:SpoVK/Ycf46/Vps4 family AAA+-type ATPase